MAKSRIIPDLPVDPPNQFSFGQLKAIGFRIPRLYQVAGIIVGGGAVALNYSQDADIFTRITWIRSAAQRKYGDCGGRWMPVEDCGWWWVVLDRLIS